MWDRSKLDVPDGVFLARREISGGTHLHTFAGLIGASRVAREARSRGITDVRMIRHRTIDFSKLHSVEDLLSRVEGGAITADPSGIFARAAAIALLSRWIRREMKNRVRHLYLNTRRRTLYVIVRPGAGSIDATVSLAEQAWLTGCARLLLQTWKRLLRPDFDLAIRIGITPPVGVPVVSLDRQSAPGGLFDRSWKRIGGGLIAAGLATMLGLPAAAAADIQAPVSSPAVESPNMTVSTKVGDVDGNFFYGGGAKADIGLGESFGVQVEGGVGSDDYYGIAGHLFWRHPDAGMVGVYASAEGYEHIDMQRIAAEAEMYLDNLTLGGRLGYQDGEVESGLLATADVSFYLTPNFALRAGGEYNPELALGKLGFEWQPGFTEMWGLSVYADVALGEHSYDSIMAGIRIPFGTKGASLMDIERRFDPPEVTWNFLPMLRAADQRSSGRSGY